MRVDISMLPALAATFMLVFARIGTMVMLLPGLGEMSMPVRVRLTIALVLSAMFLPLHRNAYNIDLREFGPVLFMLGHEILIGAILGLVARLSISALQVAGAVIAQQIGLGFVTAVDPTQGQQNVCRSATSSRMLGMTLIFATDMHHLVIAALNDSYRIFAPGADDAWTGDVAETDATRYFRRPPSRSACNCSARRFWCSACVFNLGLGVLARLMPADAGLSSSACRSRS
jgi:flagellar biosynthetic protein FliR